MEKYFARQSDFQSQRMGYCRTACKQCADCKTEMRSWSDCWSACDECNRCYAEAYRSDLYTEPYYYRISNRTLKTTPALAKQYCDGICGVNMCNEYKQRLVGYKQCQDNTECKRKWGCPNPNGAEFGYVAPIDPMYTDCQPCWK